MTDRWDLSYVVDQMGRLFDEAEAGKTAEARIKAICDQENIPHGTVGEMTTRIMHVFGLLHSAVDAENQRIGELEDQLAAGETLTTRLATKRAELEGQVIQLTAELAHVRSARERAEAGYDDLLNTVADLKEQLATLHTKLTQLIDQ